MIAFHYSKNRYISVRTFFLICFYPVMLFNSVHVFRDTIISFIVVYIFYRLLTNRKSIINYFKLTPFLLILYFFRVSTFFMSILMILLLSFNFKSILRQGIIVFIIFSFIIYFFMRENFELLLIAAERYNAINANRLGFIGSKIFELPLILGIIPRLIFILFVPVPNFTSFHQFYVSISAILQVTYFPFLFWGLLSKKNDSKLMLTFLLFFFGVALTTATFRHVMMFLPFGIIITVISYYNSGFKFNSYKYLFTFLGLIVTFFYSITLALIY